ncbi:MAG: LEA type 2 family protein [Acidobacteriota bacterium]|nr:LEA type 2 family protein [Acidobacteriota bacterium]
MRRRLPIALFVVVLAASESGCAALEGLRALVQPPQFSEAEGQRAEIRLLPPGQGGLLGGAAIRLYARVRNPNPFGLTLSTLRGNLFLDGSRAAEADFPLGLPLAAGGDAVVPLDLRVSFSDLPGLADVVRRAAAGQTLGYRLDGTVGVDAGQLGRPSFGPLTLLTGDLRTH